uniref:hypothetical protein n=1 Tax=Rhodococcus globerulus TaxID=33008 RepID=UPI003019B457
PLPRQCPPFRAPPQSIRQAVKSGTDTLTLDPEDTVHLTAQTRSRQRVARFLGQNRADADVELQVCLLSERVTRSGIVLAKVSLADLK